MRYLPIACSMAMLPLLPAAAAAQQPVESEVSTEYQALRIERLAPASHPWGIAFIGDGRLLVSERAGRLFIIENGRRTQVTGVPEVRARNQGGLLDVVAHPGYADNGWVYITYSTGTEERTTTALGRARLDGSRLTDFQELFVSNAWGHPGGHYGSRILFLGDGTLLMTVGDRMRNPERAQDPRDHAGSILRLRDDGTVPADNPFAGRAGYAPEVYSYGHRNIQGIAMQPVTRDVWIFEHGPRGSDLLHHVQPGRNYGWPLTTQGREYRTQQPFGQGVEEARRLMPEGTDIAAPVHEFVLTIAPSGLAFVTGTHWDETWQGNLLGGGLRAQRIVRMVLEEGGLAHAEELLTQRLGRIRDVRVGPDGYIYVATDEEEGGIYRISPAN
jgi:aldose sugar dehydrogenase